MPCFGERRGMQVPHRVLERDVNLNLGGALIVVLWAGAFAFATAAWVVGTGGSRPLIHASLMLGLLAVSVGQVKGNMRQRSMCAARLDLAEMRRTEGEGPIRRVQ